MKELYKHLCYAFLILILSVNTSVQAQIMTDEEFILFCQTGSYGEIKQLLDKGYKANIEDINLFISEGIFSPLDAAIKKNPDEDVIRLLIDKGADVNKSSVLSEAISANRSLQLIEYLISVGADVNKTSSLAEAISANSSVQLIEYLINAGADINKTDSNGWTPLHNAILIYNKEPNRGLFLINLLIKKGANVNVIDQYGNSILFHIIGYAEPDVIKILIDNGANVNFVKRTGDGFVGLPNMSVLAEALSSNYPEVIDLLIKRGADMYYKDDNGKTIIEQQYIINNPRVLDKLNDYGYEFSVQELNSLLNNICYFSPSIESVKAVIDWGADVNAVDIIPYDSSIQPGSISPTLKMINLLMDKYGDGSNYDNTYYYLSTPLLNAIYSNSENADVIKFLLLNGASTRVPYVSKLTGDYNTRYCYSLRDTVNSILERIKYDEDTKVDKINYYENVLELLDEYGD